MKQVQIWDHLKKDLKLIKLVLPVVLSKLEGLQLMSRKGINMHNAIVIWIICNVDSLKDEIILVV